MKSFIQFAKTITEELKNALLVDQVVHTFEERESLLKLLRSHISNHIIKIGTNTYRQIVGIPQGSVVSTLLCSFFYGDLERRKLSHLLTVESCLIRYVDDFLFITTDIEQAKEFCFLLHRGTFINLRLS
jgi:telomerase reverse transcriptase